MGTRKSWADFAKFLAILAVMIDHTNGVLYSNPKIAYFSYFSVSVFILISGITTYMSFEKRNVNTWGGIKKRSIGILGPYLVATFIYCIFYYRYFDLQVYLNHVIHFNVSGPLYYVLLYLQLIWIAPLLCNLIRYSGDKSYRVALFIVEILGVIAVCFLTTNYTNILSVYGGGGKLFGGNYLLLFFIGMLLGRLVPKITFSVKNLIALGIVAFGLSVTWWNFIATNQLQMDSKIPFGNGFNPPSISLIIYAILVVFTCYMLGNLIETSKNVFLLKFIL